jgi:hypothetical protein
MSDTKSQIQEAPRIPGRINVFYKEEKKIATARHIIFKLQWKIQKKILKEARGRKHLAYRGTEQQW